MTPTVDYQTLDRAIEQRAVPPLANVINLVMMPLSFALLTLVIADVNSTLRIWLTVLVFCFGPGSGIVQFFRLPDSALQLGLIVAISATFDLLLGQILLWVHDISGTYAILALTLLTFIRPLPRFVRPS